MRRKLTFVSPIFCLLTVVCFWASHSYADANGLQPLDGVKIDAVETYLNPKKKQLEFGLSLWPLDPYYNAFGINLGYRHIFGRSFSWQVLNADYLYSVDKGLTSQLAENYGVSPKQIERLNFAISSNVAYVFAYGKFVFASEHIRYFRSSFLLGPSFLQSNKRSTVGANLGWQIETFVNESFSWSFQIRDVWSPSNLGNNLVFVLGTSYAF